MLFPFANTVFLIILLMAHAFRMQDAVRPPPLQNSTPTATPSTQDTLTMPQDPAAILAASAKVNGLSGASPLPWHLRVSYQIFDDKGHSKDSGLYEEFWVSDKKYKRSYTSPNFTQSDFATDRGLYRSGNQSWPGPEEIMVRTELIDPISSALNLSGFRLESKRRSVDKVNLQCVTLKADWIFLNNDAYCFQPDKPILRLTNAGGGRSYTLHNDILLFQGHFLARNIRVMNAGKPSLVLHIESIEEEPTVNDSDLAPPPDAALIPTGKLAIPEKTMTVLLLRQVPPHYPDNAKANHIAGTVVLQITIGKDGHVTDAQAISGPNELRKASIDAVLKWEYRPFLIAGEPTEVETTLPITFTLGG
jgi:TonB family protein